MKTDFIRYQDGALIIDMRGLPMFEELSVRVCPFDVNKPTKKANVYVSLNTNMGWITTEEATDED